MNRVKGAVTGNAGAAPHYLWKPKPSPLSWKITLDHPGYSWPRGGAPLGGFLVAMRHWTRRQVMLPLLGQDEAGEAISSCRSPGPKTRRPWRSSEPTARLSVESLAGDRRSPLLPSTTCPWKLIKKIAGVYYPEEERPELKASLADLVAFHNRVGCRLAAWLETAPIRPL